MKRHTTERAWIVSHMSLLLGPGGDQGEWNDATQRAEIQPRHRETMFQLMQSLISGIEYLHSRSPATNILRGSRPTHMDRRVTIAAAGGGNYGNRAEDGQMHIVTTAKPVIAHCDIKSANVLVRKDGTCCIADFGLAVFMDPGTEHIHRPTHLAKQKGTNRYLSPECLSGTDGSSMESYLQADIYSLGLVLWEIANSCPTASNPHAAHSLPYQHKLSHGSPTMDEVKEVVCDSRLRPLVPKSWSRDKLLQEISVLLESCWSHEPHSRPCITTVKSSLEQLRAAGQQQRSNNPGNTSSVVTPTAFKVELASGGTPERVTMVTKTDTESVVSTMSDPLHLGPPPFLGEGADELNV
eukprot:scpid72329/ scgid3841/ Bone morphogenetic protein receptor type-1B; Activin receptor-like kinase 6; RPK-1; Serine/threonine-protein kinase receptor R6